MSEEEKISLESILETLGGGRGSKVAFNTFTKGLVASTQPDLMPEGSLRVCNDLCFYEDGALCVPLEPVQVVGATTTFYRSFFTVETDLLTYSYRHVDNNGADKLQGKSGVLSDLTDFNERDGSTRITVTESDIYVVSLDNDEFTSVDYDYGAAYFSGDFLFTMSFDYQEGSTGACGLWVLSNTDPASENDLVELATGDLDHLAVYFNQDANGASLTIRETNGAVDTITSSYDFCAKANKTIHDNECQDISGWTDLDNSDGESKQDTVEIDSVDYSVYSFDSGTGIGGSYACRYKDIGSYGNRVVFEIELHHSSTLGNVTDAYQGHFVLDIISDVTTCRIGFGADGLFVYDGSSWNEVGTNIVSTGILQRWTFDIDFSTYGSETVDVYLDGYLQQANVDCSYAVSATDGGVKFTQYSHPYRNNIMTYVNFIQVGDAFKTDFYLEIERDESAGTYGDLELRIYDDPSKSSQSLIDTRTIDLTEKQDFRYGHALLSYGSTGGKDLSLTLSDFAIGSVTWTDVTTFNSGLWSAVSYITSPVSVGTNFYTFIACGSIMKKVLATTASPIGCSTPAAAPTLATQGTGLTGTYTYAYTYYDSATGDEGLPSAEDSIALSNEGCRITYATDGGGTNADYVRIYRSIAGGGSLYLVAASLKATGYYDDTTVDTSLGDFLDESGVGAPPSGATILGSYLGRVWYLGYPTGGSTKCNRAYYSTKTKPGTVPTDYYVVVGNREIPLTGFSTAIGMAFFFNRDTIQYLEGNGPATFIARDTGSNVGTTATHTIASDGKSMYFVASDGVYVFSEGGPVRISDQIDWIFNPIGDVLTSSLYKPYLNRCRGTLFGNEYWIIIWTSSSTRLVLIYDIKKKVWRSRTVDLHCLFNDKANNRLLAGLEYGTGDYRVYAMENTTNGITDTFTCEARTREININDIEWLEKYKIDATGDWTITIYIDDVNVYSIALTDLTRAHVKSLKSISSSSSGSRISVKLVPTSPRPLTTRFYGIEFVNDIK